MSASCHTTSFRGEAAGLEPGIQKLVISANHLEIPGSRFQRAPE
jgi:hypothetical protein